MARTKKIKEVVVETTAPIETPITEEVIEAPESEAKKEFRKVIEAYKKQSPIKYELKKEALLKKLASL